jgi:hypothetical protein
MGQVAQYVKRLKDASAARIINDAGFKIVAEDIKTYKAGELERSRIALKEKSAKEKAAEKEKMEKRSGKKKSKSGDDAADEDAELALVDDVQMQEAIRITTDYYALRSGKNLAKLTIPEVVKAEKNRQAQEKKPSKPKS